jgi:two-component system NtrC family sensor kinase
MKKIYLLIIFFVVIANVSKAQDNQPPVYEITADTAVHQVIPDKYWQMLEDPSGTLTIGQVSSAQYSSKFHYNTTRTKGINYDIDTYWLRYRLKNTLNHPVKVTIPEYVAYAWLYIPKTNNQWQVQTNGQFVPWSKQDGLKLAQQFLLTLNAGQELDLYEKDVFEFNELKPKVFGLSIGFGDAVIKSSYIDNLSGYKNDEIYSVAFGFLLLAAVINLLFYRIVREKVYLFFSLYVLSHGVFFFVRGTYCSILSEYPRLVSCLDRLSIIVLFYTMMHFIRYFLRTKAHTPKWDKFLIILSIVIVAPFLWLWFGAGTLNYKNFTISILISNFFIYTYDPIALATLIYFIPRQKGAERMGIFAVLPPFFWLAIGYCFNRISFLLHYFYNIPYSGFYLGLRGWWNIIDLVCFLWLVIGFSLILFKRFRVMQQSLIQAELDKERIEKEKEIERSQLIEKQNAELEQQVEHRTAELTQSLHELKTTQRQLIQSEKMASLGELTAGIAHEIQNPLNFVNNFSEVNIELITEMETELENGTKEEVIEILEDIKQNLEKISHHGKRADGIVKGMLQHSRATGDTKEPTDINKLADEYLRLAYHGLRAKDKSFNAEMTTRLDETLPPVSVVPQDIGRVMLNLFNNAFYAVHEKQLKTSTGFNPAVTLTTALKSGHAVITVKDNGTGIPDEIKDKIMQPFFTTKPTGEGTGLGLSLSYDIVVKAHGGTIDLNSRESEGSEFIVTLPII